MKEHRADKELEMMLHARRNNIKQKIEVRAVMNSVIFGSWKNWVERRKARREECKRLLEEEGEEENDKETEKQGGKVSLYPLACESSAVLTT